MRVGARSVLIVAAVVGLGLLLVWLAIAPRVIAPGTTPSASASQSARASVSGSASPSESARASAVASAPPSATEITISSASAFSLCDVPNQGMVFTNTEVEPSVAVNPADRNNLIAVWQQDRSASGGARAIMTAITADGGRTWRRTASPFGECVTGIASERGDARVSDPWISCGPSGRCFQSALGVGRDGSSAVLASYSDDRGRTWSVPETIVESTSQQGFNDKETITADPRDRNFVYAIWDRPISAGQAGTPQNGPDPPDQVLFARSTDGGETWEEPRVIATDPGTPLGHQIVVLPDGTLLDAYENLARGARPRQQVLRSTDKGQTWSRPIGISTARPAPIRAAGGRSVRTGEGLPGVAVDPRSGRIFVCWEDARFTNGGHTDIVVSSSIDGGLTWSSPVRANQTPGNAAAFTPAVAVAADGRVGVSYYDLRNDTDGASLLADRFLATSADGGETWRETRLTAESFDVTKAPRVPAYFLGDYAGLVAIENRFVSVFSVTTESDTDPMRLVAVGAR